MYTPSGTLLSLAPCSTSAQVSLCIDTPLVMRSTPLGLPGPFFVFVFVVAAEADGFFCGIFLATMTYRGSPVNVLPVRFIRAVAIGLGQQSFSAVM